MSQISSVGTGGGGGTGIIQTIAGDTGSITGANVTIFANNASNLSGGSVNFINSGTVSSLQLSDASSNTFLGNGSGKPAASLGGAAQNTNIGVQSGSSLTLGANNVSVGYQSLDALSSGNSNVSLGTQSSFLLTTGSNNTAVGQGALSLLDTGSNNTAIGIGSGNSYNGAETSNLLLRNEGVTGENNTIRIGEQGTGDGQQDRNFQAGITAVTVAGSAPVAVASTGQLSSLGFGTAGEVLTSGGAGVSPTWQAGGGGGFGSPTYFSAYLSTPQSIPATTVTQVVFDTTVSNVGAAYSTATGFFTAPVTGFYGFSATIFINPAVGITTIDLGFLGSAYGTTSFQVDSSAYAVSHQYQATFSWNIPMTAGDTLGVNIYCTGTGSSTTSSGTLGATFNSQTLFSGYRIA